MISRGEVYWVSVDGSVGDEIQTGRTAVIISVNSRNEKSNTVLVAYLSTSIYSDPSRVGVSIAGKYQKVLCDQIRTVDKQRLTKYVAKLTEEEMTRVTRALANVQGIPVMTKSVPEPVEKNCDSDDVVSLRVELEMMRRMYDKVLEKLVEMRVGADMSSRVETPVSKVEEQVSEPELQSEDSEDDKVEINTCTIGQLREIGVGSIMADKILRHRPYTTVDDLKIVPGMTGISFGILKNKVYCIPKLQLKKKKTESVPVKSEPVKSESPKPDKVNVNTATAVEISEISGMGIQTAQQIVSCRKKYGGFLKLEDLFVVPRFGTKCMKLYGAKLEV